MLDFLKRLCIALALATAIGMLFLGTTTTSYAQSNQMPDELREELIWPTVGEITDYYGTRGGNHFGIDVAAPEGTPVVAIADGIVTRSYYSDTYGNVVFVRHHNGLETVYAHLYTRSAYEGQAVKEGEKMGTVGSTGRSSGNHLHFEVHHGEWNLEKNNSVDPLLVLSKEPEYMYAALGEDSPYGVDFRERSTISVMKNEESKVGQATKKVFEIKEGETLWRIAQTHEVTIAQLKEWNQLQSDTIVAGQSMVIYVESPVHIITKGETLSSIATEYGTTVHALIKKNELMNEIILPGQVIKVH